MRYASPERAGTRTLLTLLLLGCVDSCSSDVPPGGQVCVTDSDCPEGQLCRAQHCAPRPDGQVDAGAADDCTLPDLVRPDIHHAPDLHRLDLHRAPDLLSPDLHQDDLSPEDRRAGDTAPADLSGGRDLTSPDLYSNDAMAADAMGADRSSVDASGCDHIPEWWDPAYQYRRMLTVTEQAGEQLDGYSVVVRLAEEEYAALLISDKRDLRVVFDGVEIDRFVEVFWGTVFVWFKLQTPLAPFTSDGRYHLYYTDPAAGDPPARWSDSMGADPLASRVFLAADDFEGHDVGTVPNGWTEGGGSFKVDHYQDMDRLRSTQPGSWIRTTAENYDNVWISAMVWTSVPDAHPGCLSRMSDIDSQVLTGFNSREGLESGNLGVWRTIAGQQQRINAWVVDGRTVGNDWNLLEVGWVDDRTWAFLDGYGLAEGIEVNPADPSGQIGFHSSGSTGGELYVDNVIVRQLVVPEPTVTPGEEQELCR